MYEVATEFESRRRVLARCRSLATVSVLAWSLVAVGVAARVVRYADNRSLWHDEALLSLNLLERGFVDLLRPLDYLQAAPPLFLLLEKLAVLSFGPTEYALRLPPLVAAIAALILFRLLALRILPGLGALFALALFALGESLIYWSTEAKQYSFDVLAVLVLLGIAREPLLVGRFTVRRGLILALVGVVAVLFSYAAVFAVAGIGAALVLAPLAARRRPSAAALSVGVFWLAGLCALLVMIAATAGGVRGSLDQFLAESSTPLAFARDVWHAFAFPGPFARTTIGLAVLLATLGVFHLRHRCLPVLLALGATIAATMAAALARLYPFSGRFILFLVPLVLLLVGAGLEELRAATAGRTRAAWAAALALIALYSVATGLVNLVRPPESEEARDVVAMMSDRWRGGDRIVVGRFTQAVLAYYAECGDCGAMEGKAADDLRRLVLSRRTRASDRGLRHGGRLAIAELDHDLTSAAAAARFDRVRGAPRVWVLISSGWHDRLPSYVIACLGGRQLESIEATGAAAYLFDLSQSPRRSGGCAPA